MVGVGVVAGVIAYTGDDGPTAQGPSVTGQTPGSPSPSASPTTEPSPSPTIEVTTVSQEIGLVPGGELGGNALYTAGSCGGSDFGSVVTLRDDGGGELTFEQQQPIGGGQVTKVGSCPTEPRSS